MNTRQVIGVGVLAFGALLTTTAQAAICTGSLVGDICTLSGPNITWQYSVSANQTGGPTNSALYWFDAPTLVGDSIRFLPPAFSAQSTNGAGVGTASANFVFNRVFTNSGANSILGFSSSDLGDYTITQGGSVQASLYLQAADNTNVFRLANASTNYATSTLGSATLWNLTTVVDTTTAAFSPFQQIVAGHDFAVNVQDNLSASTNALGQYAFIQKKINIDVLVPVPAAAWLFGSALLGLAGVRRRMVG